MNQIVKKIYEAIYETFKRRNALNLLDELEDRYISIKDSIALKEYWENYQRVNNYARNIKYEDFVETILSIINIIDNEKQVA